MKLVKVQGPPKNPGEWEKIIGKPGVDENFAQRWPIILNCPECGKGCSVSSATHAVMFQGAGEAETFTARPSFVCPHPPCNWHVFITESEAAP